MNRVWTGSPQLPDRLSPRWAKALAAVALANLVLAAGGFFVYQDWQRAAYVTTFTTMSVANLAWAIGSLVPDERQSRALRLLFNPLAVVMLFSLGAALAFMLGCGS